MNRSEACAKWMRDLAAKIDMDLVEPADVAEQLKAAADRIGRWSEIDISDNPERQERIEEICSQVGRRLAWGDAASGAEPGTEDRLALVELARLAGLTDGQALTAVRLGVLGGLSLGTRRQERDHESRNPF